eukprot:TRINITY_DN390_c0_g1_i1.p1 TRINITY_DN390_c0_g1~~TRINITY_DN390_c0_g1_i1.p1  ORF type:complete len:176 (+),score=53.22 TRINITY_DN390_c0_g1_i1:51-578(+)
MAHEALFPPAAYPDSFDIVRQQDSEGNIVYTKLHAAKAFKKGEKICDIGNIEHGREKKWTSVQVGKNQHIELLDELVFMNHSCNPLVNLNVTDMIITAARDINAGDEITFFYPSTEWEMSCPFACNCQNINCLRVIAGAAHLTPAQLSRYFVNQHIVDLIVDSLAPARTKREDRN